MKGVRIALSVLVSIPAALLLLSALVGLINIIGGAPVYGSQRTVASLFLCALFSLFAYLLWPRTTRNESTMTEEFAGLHDDDSKAEFIATVAASRLGVSEERFGSLLSVDLHYSPREIMGLWDELGDEFGIDLSANDFPDINSIEELKKRLSDS